MGLSKKWLRENYWGDVDEIWRQARPIVVPSGLCDFGVSPNMNWTEARFSGLIHSGRWIEPVKSWDFESVTLQLSPDMKYTPDFPITLSDNTVSMVDVKGKHTFEDSIIKAKAAAVIFPQYRFYHARLISGVWRIRRMGVEGSRTIEVMA